MTRKIWGVTAFCAVSALASSAATASDGEPSNNNVLIKTGSETSNELTLQQSRNGGHSAVIDIAQEGALLLGQTWMRATNSVLVPGTIVQTGKQHVLNVSIDGQDNQFAVQQTGSRNTASILSGGRANMVSVSQAGFGNTASATQSGMRNSVAIAQK